jgi:hypothetical protein
MSLTLDDVTETRLAVTRRGIENEFDHLPREAVGAQFDAIVAELLEDASFGDFVPVLAWRYSREELLSVEGVPGDFRD